MPALAFHYPVALTNREWQKKKGLGGKSKSTGVGEKLTSLEKLVAQSPFGKLDPDTLGTETFDPVVFKQKLDGLNSRFAGAAHALAPGMTAAEKVISSAIPVFAAGSSQSVRRQLELMRTELKALDVQLKITYPTAFAAAVRSSYKNHVSKSSAYTALSGAAPSAEAVLKQLLGEIKQVESAKTIASVHATWPQDGAHRKLPTWCKLWDQLVLRDLPALAKASGYPQNAMVTIFTLPWVQEVGNENQLTATNALTALAQNAPEDKVVTRFALEYSRSVIEASKLVAAMVKSWRVLSRL